MTTLKAAALADLLDSKARTVRAIEAEAEALLKGQPDQAGYQAVMRKKAELLENLADEAETLVGALDPMLAEVASDRLQGFSASAANALRIGSVFYMSALLYPDDYKPGEPNDLERYAAEVRSWG